MLYPTTQVDEETKQIHIQNIQQRHPSTPYVNTMAIQNATDVPGKHCPNCGGQLVIRTATKGTWAGQQFWGCSNYPKCRYMENIIK